jgi:Mg-chelatase subunit ChlI
MAGGKRGPSATQQFLRRTQQDMGFDSKQLMFKSNEPEPLYPLINFLPRKLKKAEREVIVVGREIQQRIHDAHFVRPKSAIGEVIMYSEAKGNKKKAKKDDSSLIFQKVLGGLQKTARGVYFPDELMTGQVDKTGIKRMANGTFEDTKTDNKKARLKALWSREKMSKKNKNGDDDDEEEEKDDEEEGLGEDEEEEEEEDDYKVDHYASDDEGGDDGDDGEATYG